jgi:PPK2 family polyphosphate:nucleotide phosphotransferase
MTKALSASLVVVPGKRANLRARDPGDRLGMAEKSTGGQRLEALTEQLAELQNRLWAESTRSVLLVLQGMDASGKDGAIRRVFSGVNPQGCRVVSFKVPNDEERAHDYLWRVHRACPPRGDIGIFNRSHYEDVVATRVPPVIDDATAALRYRHIREFERMLIDEGTAVIKVFLHLSNDEQRKRLQARLDDPAKNWKFQKADVDARAHWDEFQRVYEEALTETSTDWAPWYVAPADHKWVRDVAIAGLLVEVLDQLDPQVPPPEPGLDGIVVV